MLETLPANEWTLEAAAHLLNRAAFGGTPRDIQMLYKMGHKAAIKKLLDPLDTNDTFSELTNELLDLKRKVESKQDKKRFAKTGMQKVKTSWLAGMHNHTFSAREKLVLFWFGSHLPVYVRNNPIVYCSYICCLKDFALGEYNKMLKGVYRQPAMRKYLTLDKNLADNPNENFARELMELFTIGEGNYTEEDVRQVARAFTGNLDGTKHDNGIKTLLNQTGNFSGDDVIDILTSMTQCSKLVSSKLWKFYVGKAADDQTANTLADIYKSNNMNTSNLLEQIFMSREFYNIKYRRIIIKSPVEWAIQLVKSLEMDINSNQNVCDIISKLGQELSEPPNVKGWSGGKNWITASSLFDRCNYSQKFVNNAADITINKIFPSKTSPELVCNIISARFFQSPPNSKLRNKLLDVLRRTTDDVSSKKEFIRLIVSTTEYQLT